MNRHRYWTRNFLYFCCICIAWMFEACDNENFSQPQPVNKENLYEFPESFRGYWYSKDNGLFYVTKNHLGRIGNDEQKLFLGAWYFIDDHTGSTGNKLMKSVRYDSLGKARDTTTDYLLRDKYIFEIKPDGSVKNGYRYSRRQDTIVYKENDTTWIDLGRNAFLRKINDTLYMMNVNNNILNIDNNWWQIVMLEKTKQGLIKLWVYTANLKNPEWLVYKGAENNYYDCKWTAGDILKMMKDGSFENISTLTKDERQHAVP